MKKTARPIKVAATTRNASCIVYRCTNCEGDAGFAPSIAADPIDCIHGCADARPEIVCAGCGELVHPSEGSRHIECEN